MEANSLGDMKRDIAGLKTDVAQLNTDVDSLAEDVAKIPVIEGEIRQINQNIGALRDRAGVQSRCEHSAGFGRNPRRDSF